MARIQFGWPGNRSSGRIGHWESHFERLLLAIVAAGHHRAIGTEILDQSTQPSRVSGVCGPKQRSELKTKSLKALLQVEIPRSKN